jgi:hypothetical protein
VGEPSASLEAMPVGDSATAPGASVGEPAACEEAIPAGDSVTAPGASVGEPTAAEEPIPVGASVAATGPLGEAAAVTSASALAPRHITL